MNIKDPTLEKFQDKFYTYVNVLCDRIASCEDKRCEREPMSGCLWWNVSGELPEGKFDCFFATPFWENEEVIPVQFMTNYGDYVAGNDIPFHINDLTMDLNKDSNRYSELIREFIKKKCNVEIPPNTLLSEL